MKSKSLLFLIPILLLIGVGGAFWYFNTADQPESDRGIEASDLPMEESCGETEYKNDLYPDFSFTFDSCEFELEESLNDSHLDSVVNINSATCSLNFSFNQQVFDNAIDREGAMEIDFISSIPRIGRFIRDNMLHYNYFMEEPRSTEIGYISSGTNFITNTTASYKNEFQDIEYSTVFIDVLSDTTSESCINSFEQIIKDFSY